MRGERWAWGGHEEGCEHVVLDDDEQRSTDE